jgi:hypothetical protein
MGPTGERASAFEYITPPSAQRARERARLVVEDDGRCGTVLVGCYAPGGISERRM